MRGTTCLTALALLASAAYAQHAGGFGNAAHMGGHADGGRSIGITGGARGNSGWDRLPPGATLPVVTPIPPFDGRANAVANRRHFGRFYGGSGVYPFYADEGGGYQAQGPSTTYIVTPPAAEPAAAPAPPPHPIHLVIHNYNNAHAAGGAANEHQTFTIALKDGSTRSAQLSWVSGAALHYLDADGDEQMLTRSQIDRRKTEALNHEKDIQLLLPPGTK